MTTFCYKVCRVVDGKYFSEFGDEFPKWDTEYKIGEYVYPPVGKLFMYLDIAAAIERKWDGSVILQCIVPGDVEYVNAAEFEEVENEDFFPQYWKDRRVRSPYSSMRSNIALVDSVNVLKVFSDEEITELARILNLVVLQ